MAKRPGTNPKNEWAFFDVLYEDGSQRSNRRVPAELLGGLEKDDPFGAEPTHASVVPFVSILSKTGKDKPTLPIELPESGEWFVRILGANKRIVFGVYRRHMKTIGYLDRIDEIFGAPATTRSWNTIVSVLRILKNPGRGALGG